MQGPILEGTGSCTVQDGGARCQRRAKTAMAVICLLNQKGGVGKTSTCHHLAGTLARDGKKVLLIDNDPQASLTQGFWGPLATRQLDPAETIAAILGGRGALPRRGHQADRDCRHRHPARLEAGHELQRPRPAPGRPGRCSSRSRRSSKRSKCRTTIVLIDCPPNLHLCSWVALVARATT